MGSADPVIVTGLRTPVGTAGSALAAVSAERLAAPVLSGCRTRLESLGLPGVDEVMLGNCLGPGGNIARVAALAAGLDPAVPAVTVDRQCGSGLDAVIRAAQSVASGANAVVLAGGVESASTAPWRYWPPASGAGTGPAAEPAAEPRRYTRAPFAPAGFADPEMGAAADALAREFGITRQQQDAYAAESHRRSYRSAEDGSFAAEIVALRDLSRDQRPRAGMTAERLARLPTAFGSERDGATATAGNSCGISDGAAAVAVVRADLLPAGTVGLAVLDSVAVGCDPALPGLGAAEAVLMLLRRNTIDPAAVDSYEITEAFATVPLVVAALAAVPRERICPGGGAIGYGHPWGASGAIGAVRLWHTLTPATSGVGYGVVACAVGGGQGVAMLVRRVTR